MPTDTEGRAQKVRLTPAQAIDKAREHYSQGHFDVASRVLAAVLQVLPRNADALNLAAATAFARGEASQAVELMERAVDIHPANPVFLANLAEMRRSAGDKAGGLDAARRAVSAGPAVAVAHANLGIALYDAGDLDGAEAAQNTALTIEPRQPRCINNLGSIARDRGDRKAAADLYRRALRLAPADDEIACNLGTVLVEDDRPEEALRFLPGYVSSRPSVPAETHAVIGRAHLQLDDLDEAERAFRTALSIDARHVSAHVGLSQVLQQKNHAEKALAIALAATKIDPGSAQAHYTAGLCLAELGASDKAREAYERALELDPSLHAALMSLGYLAMELGDGEAAHGFFKRAVEKKPSEYGGHLGLVRLGKVRDGDPAMAALEAAVPSIGSMPPKRAIALHYALGKGYEDQKRFDQAWQHYAEGARLKRGTINYDPGMFEDRVDHIIDVMNTATIDRLRGYAVHSDRPIFVLGMPRSGTTLSETVIASHPDVYGAGELNDLQRLLPLETGDPESRYPFTVTRLDRRGLSTVAQSYVDGLTRRAPDKSHITDKMPANFLYLGLIHALMPGARIIHTVRDPLDTCVSCFTRLFDRAQLHSYDQVEVARFYNAYRRLMEHWRRVLPESAFLDLEYETLVADFEPQARRLIDWCGLSWNDACLTPHETQRSIRTASVTQVREPIYTSSIAKWKAYEAYLGPMINTLSSY